MKTIIPTRLAVRATACSCASLLLLNACSEKSKAAIETFKDQAEDQLVEQAGRGEVALNLMQKEYSSHKEDLVTLKTIRISSLRRAEELEQQAKQHAANGKPEKAALAQTKAAEYRARAATLQESEAQALTKLKEYAQFYETTKEQVQFLKEDIASTQAIGGIDNTDIHSTRKQRQDTINAQIDAMKTTLDRSKAIIEANRAALPSE